MCYHNVSWVFKDMFKGCLWFKDSFKGLKLPSEPCYQGVMATSKGLVVGDLKYTNVEGVTVDCNLAVGGDTIPQDVSSIYNISTDARHARTAAF